MRDRHRPRLCESCQAPIARKDDARWRCATPSADDGPRSTPSTTRPRHSARQHQSTVDAGIVGRRAHATAARRRPVAATTAEPDLSRTAPAAASVPRRPAPDLVREGLSEPTPLRTRHTRDTIEAERDRRRQRGARGAIVHRGTVLGGERPLRAHRGGNCVARPREGDEERVTLGVNLATVVLVERCPQQALMLGKDLGVAAAQPRQ
jgi:hypothetical protein